MREGAGQPFLQARDDQIELALHHSKKPRATHGPMLPMQRPRETEP